MMCVACRLFGERSRRRTGARVRLVARDGFTPLNRMFIYKNHCIYSPTRRPHLPGGPGNPARGWEGCPRRGRSAGEGTRSRFGRRASGWSQSRVMGTWEWPSPPAPRQTQDDDPRAGHSPRQASPFARGTGLRIIAAQGLRPPPSRCGALNRARRDPTYRVRSRARASAVDGRGSDGDRVGDVADRGASRRDGGTAAPRDELLQLAG